MYTKQWDHWTMRSLKYPFVNNMLVSFRPREEKITNYAFFWMFTERTVDWEVMETTVQLLVGECMTATKSLCVRLLGSSSMQRFWTTNSNQKWTVSLVNWSSQYHIKFHLVKYFFSLVETNSLVIWERPLSWHAKYSLPVSVHGSNITCFGSLLSGFG